MSGRRRTSARLALLAALAALAAGATIAGTECAELRDGHGIHVKCRRELVEALKILNMTVMRAGQCPEWRLRHLADRHAVLPIRRADADVAGVAAEPAFEFRIADGDEAARLGHLVEIRDALGLP
jgi:hypothetical protein